jgi:acetyl esterase/lipase
VLYVHGGGWVYSGPAMTRNRTVRRWRGEGVAVWSTDYRPGAASLGDVERAYATVRRRVGLRRRVCLHGESAGAQLALMVAAREPSVDCVISDSGVVDLAAVPRTSELRPIIDGALLAHGGLRRWDPLTNARRIRQPVLLVAHRDDPVVSPDQSRRLAAALAHAAFIELPPGPRTGPASYHGRHTTPAADHRAWRVGVRLVRAGVLPARR